jgi:hypothetical protein
VIAPRLWFVVVTLALVATVSEVLKVGVRRVHR